MQVLLPEIVAEARDLSLPLLILGGLAGLMLWLAGWWSHRFWVVLIATVTAGVVGLYQGNVLGMPPLIAALLLALSAGLVAMSLMRLFAFALGGVTSLILVRWLAPSVEAPLICFLVGGILTTLLYRLSVMILTSLLGTMLVGYCVLCLLGRFSSVDTVAWSLEHTALLNWLCGVNTFLGCVGQFLLSRKKKAAPAPVEAEEEDETPPPKKKHDKKEPKAEKSWPWGHLPFRKAA